MADNRANTKTSASHGSDTVLAALEEIRATVSELSARVRALETGVPTPVAPATPLVAAPPPPAAPQEQAISDETLTAIAAAVAAFLGKRAHVRQVRLISSSA